MHRVQATHRAFTGYAHCNVTAASISWLESSQAWFISDLAHMWPLQQGMPKDLAVLNIRSAPPDMVTAFAQGDAAVTATVQWDAWQLGLLAYELVLGVPLFDLDLPVQYVQMMLTNQSPLPWEVSGVCTPFPFQCSCYYAQCY
jgi:hypothetical protein